MDTSTVIEALRLLTCLVARHAQAKARSASSRYATQIRSKAFRDAAFQTVSIAFALVLFAQVGFIVHLISFLDPVIGRERAAIVVALLTAMAMAGRVLFSTVIDRFNQRLASAISFVSQAVAGQAYVARMKRSEIRGRRNLASRFPDFAALHPGYEPKLPVGATNRQDRAGA
jgi:hypothetical protein